MAGKDFGTLGYAGWVVLKAALFVVGSFVFSAIFWWTKKCVEKKGKKRK